MLIHLIQRHESESGEEVPVDLHLVDGSDGDCVHLPSCTGLVTHSQTKLHKTLKANLLRDECFETAVNLPIVELHSYTLKTLINDYFQLQREFLDQMFHN